MNINKNSQLTNEELFEKANILFGKAKHKYPDVPVDSRGMARHYSNISDLLYETIAILDVLEERFSQEAREWHTSNSIRTENVTSNFDAFEGGRKGGSGSKRGSKRKAQTKKRRH